MSIFFNECTNFQNYNCIGFKYDHSEILAISIHPLFYVKKRIRCTTFLPPFFPEIRGFIVKNWLYIYDSKYCPSLATTFSIFRAYESRVEKTDHLLRLSTNRSNFLLLHKKCWLVKPCAIDRNK